MKDLLHRFLSGVVLGIGFLATVAVAALVFGLVESSRQSTAKPQLLWHRNYTPEVPIHIKSLIGVHRPGGYDFRGTLRNDDKDAWRAIILTVELYSEGGGLLYTCTEYYNPTISPMSERQFVVRCPERGAHAINPRPPRYKIIIDGAQHVSEWTGT